MSTNPYDGPESRSAGMTGTAKLLVGLGIGCGVMVLLCCGGGAWSVYWYGKSIQESVSKDPARIREVTSSIVAIDIPESLPPVMCMAIPIPVLNKDFMTWVQYGDDVEQMGKGNMLALIQFFQQFDEQQMHAQWRQSMRQNGRRDLEDVDVEQSETHEGEVNGQPATFKIIRGRTHRTQRAVWQVSGAFHGKGGTAILMVLVDQAEFSKEDLVKILDSMH